MSSESPRIMSDITDLLANDYTVKMVDGNMRVLIIDLPGPENSLYEGYIWSVRVELVKEYPQKSPSVGFVTKIYHPNVDFHSGSICVNVLNEDWSPATTLLEIFKQFLPDLLRNPNPASPLNTEAGRLMLEELPRYEHIVKAHCRMYAKPNAEAETQAEDQEESSSEENSEEDNSA